MSSSDVKMWPRVGKPSLWCSPIKKKFGGVRSGLLGCHKPFEISLSPKKERNNCIVLLTVCAVALSYWNQMKRSSRSNNETNCWMRFWYRCTFIVSKKKTGPITRFLKWRTMFQSSVDANSIQHSREGSHPTTAYNFVHWRTQTNAPRPCLKEKLHLTSLNHVA